MIKRFMPKTEFGKNVVTLLTGNSIAQAIPIAISPILTRLYTPEDFGIFALYLSIVSILVILATGKYDVAIMLPKKDADAINLLLLSLIITSIRSIAVLIVIILFKSQIVEMLNEPLIANWLYFIPLSIILTAMYQCFSVWNNRKKNYKSISQSLIARSFVTGSINIGAGVTQKGVFGLILGNIIGQAISLLIIVNKNTISFQLIRKFVLFSKIMALLKKYKKMPLVLLPNSFIDAVRVNGLNFLIINFFSNAMLGQFSLAWKVAYMPMSLIGQSLAQVLFEKMASSEKFLIFAIVKQFLLKVSIISLPVFLLLYFIAPSLFGVVFGSDWEIAGKAVSALTPWLYCSFITSPLSSVFIILNRQEISILISFIYMLIPLIVILMYNNLGFINVITIISWSMCVLLLIYILTILFIADIERKK